MKTEKQIAATALGDTYILGEIAALDGLVEQVVTIANSHETLGTGNGVTHGDNMQMRWYGTRIMNRINDILDTWDNYYKRGTEEHNQFLEYKEKLYYKMQETKFKFQLNTRY